MMNDKDEFLKQMENLNVPVVTPGAHQNITKMAILNASRSAALGVWLIAVPCYFLFCVFMYYSFHTHISWFGAMFILADSLDKNPYISYLAPIVLVVLPIVCIVVNGLSIVHVQYQKLGEQYGKVKEFNISIRIKPWNIVLILLSMAIVFVFIAFVITQNVSIKN